MKTRCKTLILPLWKAKKNIGEKWEWKRLDFCRPHNAQMRKRRLYQLHTFPSTYDCYWFLKIKNYLIKIRKKYIWVQLLKMYQWVQDNLVWWNHSHTMWQTKLWKQVETHQNRNRLTETGTANAPWKHHVQPILTSDIVFYLNYVFTYRQKQIIDLTFVFSL